MQSNLDWKSVMTITGPQGVVCNWPGAIYMYKSIKIYTRTRCQVSVYRTTGPLLLSFISICKLLR